MTTAALKASIAHAIGQIQPELLASHKKYDISDARCPTKRRRTFARCNILYTMALERIKNIDDITHVHFA